MLFLATIPPDWQAGSLSCERHPQQLQQALTFLVRPGCGDDTYLHASHFVNGIVIYLWPHKLLLKAQSVIASAIEGVGGDTTEIALARKGDVTQAI